MADIGNTRAPWWTVSIVAFLCAIPALAGVLLVDGKLKPLVGFGMNDLQHAVDLNAANAIFAAWRAGSAEAHTLIGVSLGIDYLFMPLYCAAFFFGALAVRNSLTPAPSLARSILGVLSVAILIGTALDAIENPLQFQALMGTGPVETAYRLTAFKWPFVYVGMGLVVIGGALTLAKKFLRK